MIRAGYIWSDTITTYMIPQNCKPSALNHTQKLDTTPIIVFTSVILAGEESVFSVPSTAALGDDRAIVVLFKAR